MVQGMRRQEDNSESLLQQATNSSRDRATQKQLEKRQRDDAAKRRLCLDHGVALLEIPEIPEILPLEAVRGFVKKQLTDLGARLLSDFDTLSVDLKEAFSPPGRARPRSTIPQIVSGRIAQQSLKLGA